MAYQAPRVIKLAYTGRVFETPLFVAAHQGFFKAEGLNIKLIKTDEAKLPGLVAAGKVAGTTGDYRIFKAVHHRMPLQLVAGLHGGCVQIVVADRSKIKSLRDLRHQVLGVAAAGDGPMVVAARLLRKNGIDVTREITWKVLNATALPKALAAGTVAAVCRWEPVQAKREVENPDWRILFTTAGNNGWLHLHNANRHFYGSFIALDSRFILKQPQQAAALSRAWLMATAWVARHQRAAVRLAGTNQYLDGHYAEILKLHQSYMWMPGVRNLRQNALFYIDEQKRLGILPPKLNERQFFNQLFVPLIPDLNGR